MLIHLSTSNPKPMYEQVVEEIQRLVVTGEMEPGEMLPSIRELAKELTTSGITIRRAYQELEHSGFIYTRAGKGSSVAELGKEKLAQWKMEQVREPLWESIIRAKRLNLAQEQFQDMIKRMWEEANGGQSSKSSEEDNND